MPVDNLLRLSFESHADFLMHEAANGLMLAAIWRHHMDLVDEAGVDLPGICDTCVKQTRYTAPPGFNGSWWASLACGCGLNALDRAVLRALIDEGKASGEIYHVGHFSYFAQWLRAAGMPLTTSQYEPSRPRGEVIDGIRYENLTDLTFPSYRFDCVIATEILEHIPDYRRALREIARVLRHGGRGLLTFPWLGGNHYEHLTRAELLSDGTVQHIEPPEYHSDPANPDGILSFRSFGWKILDEMREAGFRRAEARFIYSPMHGHMTLLTPVVIGTC
jgi:SAM-dependent methyltransferase